MEQKVLFNWTLAAFPEDRAERWAWFWGQGLSMGIECKDAWSSCSVVGIDCAPFHSLKCHDLKSQVMGVKREEAWGVRI